ncbi:MAG: chorismate synthase, partial [Endomicrobiia bacterium]
GVSAKVSSIAKNELQHKTEMSFVRCPDSVATKKMIQIIKKASSQGDTLGGKFRIIAENLPVGLGSHTQWDMKLDGRIAQSLVSIQAIKSVEFGLGTKFAKILGSDAHDEIYYSAKKGFYRTTNRAGGTEGGISNGESIEVSCTMKPIPSLSKPLKSVNVHTKKIEKAEAIRSDVCAVPAAGIVAEAAVAFELAKAMQEKFGGDCLEDMKNNYKSYISRIQVI